MKRDLFIELLPVKEETLSPQAFIELAQSEPNLIARSRIAPPRLGTAGFGSIQVEYTRPRYKLAIGAVFGAFGGYGYKAVKDKHKSPADN